MGKDSSEKHRRADRESEPFLLFRRSLLYSAQFSALSTPSRSLILEMHGMFNGANNGTVFLSVRDAAGRLGFSDLKAAMRAFNECADLGWLTETIGASFKLKADTFSRARAWRLNWIQCGKCAGPDAIPALDFKRLSTTQKRRVRERQATLDQYVRSYVENKLAVEVSSTLGARKALASAFGVEESSTLKTENGENLPISSVEESTTHISTMGVQALPALKTLKHDPDFAGGLSGDQLATAKQVAELQRTLNRTGRSLRLSDRRAAGAAS